MACTVMVIIAGTMAGLATTVLTGSEYADGQGLAAQHAQVALERINRTVRGAVANPNFPGVFVVGASTGGWTFYDTLVVWTPAVANGIAANNPAGAPRMNELVVFCPHPDYPNRLVQITANSSDMGELSSVPVARANQINAMKLAPSSTVVTLTELVRTASVNGSASASDLRGAVQFAVRVLPSETEWANYPGSVSWESLHWAQSIRSAHTGLRQVWVRTELQILPGPGASSREAIPFLESAALYYELSR